MYSKGSNTCQIISINRYDSYTSRTAQTALTASTTPNQVTEYEVTTDEDGAALGLAAEGLIKQLQETITAVDILPTHKFGLLARAEVLAKTYEHGNIRAAQQLARSLQRTVERLKKQNRIPEETADTLLDLLEQISQRLAEETDKPQKPKKPHNPWELPSLPELPKVKAVKWYD